MQATCGVGQMSARCRGGPVMAHWSMSSTFSAGAPVQAHRSAARASCQQQRRWCPHPARARYIMAWAAPSMQLLKGGLGVAAESLQRCVEAALLLAVLLPLGPLGPLGLRRVLGLLLLLPLGLWLD